MAAMDVAHHYIPMLGPVSTDTVLRMQAVFGSFFAWLTGAGAGYLQTIFAGVPEIVGQLTRAAVSFGQAFIAIMAASMPAAVRLAYWIADIAAKFASWAQSAKGQGQVVTAAGMAGSMFGALWDAVVRIGAAFLRFSMVSGPGLAGAFSVAGTVVTALIDGLT